MLAALQSTLIVTLLASSLISTSGSDEVPPQTGIEGAWATNANHSVEIRGSRTSPSERSDPASPISRPDPGAYTGPPPRVFNYEECMDDWGTLGCYRGPGDEEEPVEEEPESGSPAITITDLAQFAPAATPLGGEPANLGIAGMPTNFIAPASVTTVSGTLFGLPLTVRFTPAAYEFHFGDGSDATTTTGGQSWEALGQAQFTPTATSHVYRDRGSYSADVDVRYTAEVDLGTGWIPVAGELTAEGPAQEIRIFEARTALVAYTCDQKPSSPGC